MVVIRKYMMHGVQGLTLNSAVFDMGGMLDVFNAPPPLAEMA